MHFQLWHPNESRQRALSLSESARFHLLSFGLAPTPHNYEICYTYASGENRTLNAAVDLLLSNSEKLSDAEFDKLHEFHLAGGRTIMKVGELCASIGTELNDVVQQMATSSGTTSSYGDALQLASQFLSDPRDLTSVQGTVRELIAATLEMQRDSLGLRARLDGATQQISELQQGLENVRMESRTDGLTEIGNRKHFDETLSEFVRASHRDGTPLSLLMIDIDHFKSFNDSFGHSTGDQVLRLVAKTLKDNTRGTDVAARYGGEEFGIVLPNTALKEAGELAEQIRRAIARRELKKKSTNALIGRITVSIGVASLLEFDSGESIIERADRCLYAAKRSGRNRVLGVVEETSAGQVARVA